MYTTIAMVTCSSLPEALLVCYQRSKKIPKTKKRKEISTGIDVLNHFAVPLVKLAADLKHLVVACRLAKNIL